MVPHLTTMPSRRRLLTALGAGLGLAGCTAGPGETPTGTDDTPTDTTGVDGPGESGTATRTPSGEPPSGPAVEWTRYLGDGPVSAITATTGRVYAVGGTNDRATPNPKREYLRPESSQNLVAFTPGGDRRWRHEAAGGVFDPTPAAGGVYAVIGWDAGTHGVDHRVVRLEGGERQWAGARSNRYLELLATAGDAVFVGTSDDGVSSSGESVFSLAADGTERWRTGGGDAWRGIVRDRTLYVPFGGRQVAAFDTEDGERRWETRGDSVNETPQPSSGRVFVGSGKETSDGYPVRALDAATGAEQWSFVSLAEGDEQFLGTGAVRQGDTVYVTEYDGTLFALDASDGSERWRYRTAGQIREQPLVVGDTVYLGTHEDGIHAVSTAGDRRWRRRDGPVRLEDADDAGVTTTIRGEEGSELVAFGHDGDPRWSHTTTDDPYPFATVGSRVYLGTEDGYLVALGG
jgi:outer membrane protein assembly factor BamB